MIRNGLMVTRSSTAASPLTLLGRNIFRLKLKNAILRPRAFHETRYLCKVKPFLLADVGEGIREVQIIQWFVGEGARISQFDPIVEVQHDKASVEVTSRFDGVIKKLHYAVDDFAQVGKALVDIDVHDDVPEDESVTELQQSSSSRTERESQPTDGKVTSTREDTSKHAADQTKLVDKVKESYQHRALATPAVRHIVKQHELDIGTINGTGKDGRVLKEDVFKVIKHRDHPSTAPVDSQHAATPMADKAVVMTPRQTQMLKTMTKSLAIPHFLYSDTVDTGKLTALRKDLNVDRPEAKLSSLAFILKAVSIALTEFPILNAKLDLDTHPEKPHISYRSNHNFGIAVDTVDGLLVPVVKNIQGKSIVSLAEEIRRLSAQGRAGTLSNDDLSGGTFTVSNVGSIGGGVVSPVIVQGQTSIVGIGRAKMVPAFDSVGQLVSREECTFSWSADHRIVDGATVARCAEKVRALLEQPGRMLVDLR